MNDFTKEELQIAKDGIDWMISECEMSHNKTNADEWRRVKEKIQSMIDNYCEHHLCNIDKKYSPLRCLKCQKIIL